MTNKTEKSIFDVSDLEKINQLHKRYLERGLISYGDLRRIQDRERQRIKAEVEKVLDDVFSKAKKNDRGIMKKQHVRNIEEELKKRLLGEKQPRGIK